MHLSHQNLSGLASLSAITQAEIDEAIISGAFDPASIAPTYQYTYLSASPTIPTLNTAPPVQPIVTQPVSNLVNPAIPGPKSASDWSRSLTLLPGLQSTLGMNNLMFSISGGLSVVLIASLLLSGSSGRRR